MSVGRINKILSFSEKLYRVLLIAYPKNFRQSYGDEMMQAFGDLCRQKLTHEGFLALFVVWIRALLDTVLNASAERLKMTRVRGSEMVQQLQTVLATPGFWIPGWRQVFVFAVLLVLGAVIWVLGTPSVAAPLLGEPFYERAFGFPFYFGVPLYALAALLAGIVFPKCFYLWGVALVLPFLFASIAHALWQDLALGLDIVRGGAFEWASFVFVVVMMTVAYSIVTTALSALGAGLRLLVGYGTDRTGGETA